MIFSPTLARRRNALLGGLVFITVVFLFWHAGYSLDLGSSSPVVDATKSVQQPAGGHVNGAEEPKAGPGQVVEVPQQQPQQQPPQPQPQPQPQTPSPPPPSPPPPQPPLPQTPAKEHHERPKEKYDPKRWESFEWIADYYRNNGILKIKEDTNGAVAAPYSPYPLYNSEAWKKDWRGQFVDCTGPRGKLLNESAEDVLYAYHPPLGHFPPVAVGDANVTGIDLSVCFDRFHRYGPYGYGRPDEQVVGDWQPPANPVDWNSVNWGQLQNECLMANKERYEPAARQPPKINPKKSDPPAKAASTLDDKRPTPRHHHRTAILIRTWQGYKYKENDLQAIRALITETSLLSGGEYQVFLFVNVKSRSVDFQGDPEARENFLREHVPEELRDISILWKEETMAEWYPRVGDWQVYWSQFMSLQWFTQTYPEFDFVWNWEVDTRYTGNHYHFFEGVTDFATGYPRKYMWERNQRYYFPFVHGSHQQWLDSTDREIERGMREDTCDPVWGPKPYNDTLQAPIGPKPPTSMEADHFEWGVGEQADLITLLPIWDPTHSNWDYRDKIWNFVPGVRPHFTAQDGADRKFTHPEFVNIPRRVYINTVSRFSKRLLHAMHLENTAGRNMQAEMWPATVALHHGLKAVYSPHPIWMDRKWSPSYAESVFNADGGLAAQWGQQKDAVYDHSRERNFEGWTWYYNSRFGQALYRRWLGMTAEDAFPKTKFGGREFEEQGVNIDIPNSDPPSTQLGQATPFARVGGSGPMCLPGILLHPIKKTTEDVKR